MRKDHNSYSSTDPDATWGTSPHNGEADQCFLSFSMAGINYWRVVGRSVRIVLRLGCRFDYGARGLNVITLLPLVEFSKRRSKPKISFPFSFRFAAVWKGMRAGFGFAFGFFGDGPVHKYQ